MATEKTRLNNSGEFIITSERFRTQRENFEDCVEKLFTCVKKAAEIDGETSEEKKKKIAKQSEIILGNAEWPPMTSTNTDKYFFFV